MPSTTLGRMGLGVTLGASLVVVLDFSIVNVALPALSVEMGVSTRTAEWVITAYALTFGGLLVLGGRGQSVCVYRFPATTHYPGLGIVLLAFGFGSTNVVFGSTVAVSASVVNSEQGLAGALVNATRQIGAAVGVAVLLSIVAIDATAHAPIASLADGYRLALLCAAGVAAAAAILSLRISDGYMRAVTVLAP